MCGITGIIDPKASVVTIQHTLQRMTDAIIHRGPDDEGFFAMPGIGLGMRRLSIIDVTGGHQPIANEDGGIQVVCNGEIYNYPELRTTLEQRGHVFRTRSDTEVIAHLYEDHGVECLASLRGMFSIALWDERNRRLLFARDRLGKKPLFYTQQNDRLLFGSEIKAILAAIPDLAEPNLDMLITYLRFGFTPEPHTMFRHIYKLPAAHFLLFEQERVTIEPYWQLHFADIDYTRRPRQWLDELDALLEEAVRIRFMSEVPLGVFLSGGLDSSAVVAYAHKAGLSPLKTFTIGFDHPEWDESADAKLVAQHFQTEHHVLTLREQEMAQQLPETMLTITRHFDEPFGDSSALPTFHISKLARQHVTVILSGDGGDELFAGYTSYQGAHFAERYRRLPSSLIAVFPTWITTIAEYMPRTLRYRALRTAKVLQDSAYPFETMYFSKMALCNTPQLNYILNPDIAAQFGQAQFANPAGIATLLRTNLPAVNRMAYADIRFRLLDDMLVKVDRMSMANALEVRSPFLDQRLIEFVSKMPPHLKLRGWETKAILRDTVRPYLPKPILRKPKQGFSVPLREWLRNGLYPMAYDYIAHLPIDVFNRDSTCEMLQQHRRGDRDHSAIIWLLLNYAVWYELYMNQKVFH